jgi:NAD(P)-dependent dehydrogenase (short-subunit alcohol dehydrogenase family)
MSINWLEGMHQQMDGQMEMDGPGRPRAMPVFAGQKLVVVGGSSGMGRQTAEDVVAAGGSAVIVGQDPARVDDTVQTLAKDGEAYGITADLADRDQVERVRQQLAGEHADATLLVNAAGLFIPTPFLDYDGPSYDTYLELDRAIFFLTQTVARGMAAGRRGGSIVNVGPSGHRGHPVVGVLGGQGRAARAHPQPGHGAGPAPDPGQRGRPGRCRHPDL